MENRVRSKAVYKLIGIAMMAIFFSLWVSISVTAAPPQVPTGLKQVSAYETSVRLEWNAVAGSRIYYDVEYSVDNKVWYSKTSASSASYYMNGLTAGKTYYLRVRAYEYQYGTTPEKSAWATKAVVTIPKDVGSVTQKSATASSVTLSWKASSGANRYKVTMVQSGKETKTYYTTTNSITIKSLSAGKEYTFRVRPQRTISGYTAEQSYGRSIYGVGTVPGSISSLQVSNSWPSISEVGMQWGKQESADGYQVELYTLGSAKVGRTMTTSSGYASLENVKSTAFYKARVRGYVIAGTSKKYGVWTTICITNQPKVSSSQSGSKIVSSWSKVSGATSYSVYISNNRSTGFKKVGTTTGTKMNISKYGTSALKKGSYYYIYVRAYKKVGTKTYSSKETYSYPISYR